MYRACRAVTEGNKDSLCNDTNYREVTEPDDDQGSILPLIVVITKSLKSIFSGSTGPIYKISTVSGP